MCARAVRGVFFFLGGDEVGHRALEQDIAITCAAELVKDGRGIMITAMA